MINVSIQVVPAIIPDSLKTIEEKFGKVLNLVKKVQIDFTDGIYAPVQSWPWVEGGEEELSKFFIGEEKFPFLNEFEIEADLLLSEPEKILGKFIAVGFESFVIHIDSTHNVYECIDLVKKAERKVGLGIKPSVDSLILEQYLNKCDFVQFMGNDKIGFNGVKLDEKVLDKIKNFHAIHPEIPLQIDIGVNFETAPRLIEAGITGLVSGSTVFESEIGAAEAIKKLKN